MRIGCPRICSRAKNTAVHEPELTEKTVSVQSLAIESQKNEAENRKISIDQFSHVFDDEYASGEFSYFRLIPL